MCKNFRLSYILIHIIAFSLTIGCDGEIEKPQVTAVQFLNAVYKDNDLEKAKSFAAGRLRERMNHTPTIRTLQYYVMGVVMEETEKIRFIEADMDFFHLKTINVRIIYQLIGKRNGIPFMDLITMRMDYDENIDDWRVTKIIPDKFNIHLLSHHQRSSTFKSSAEPIKIEKGLPLVE